MSNDVAPLLEGEIEINATPEQVWAIVKDPVRMGSFSPQVIRTVVLGGKGVGVGTKTLNLNHRGLLVWPTRAKVVEFDAPRRYAYRVKDNFSVWSFTLEPSAAGTKVTHRREVPQGLSDVSITLTDKVLGGQQVFTAELQQGISQTLRRLKAEAERVR